MKIEINGKALAAVLALSGSIVFADFVSIANVKDSGGITLAGVSDTELDTALNEMKADYESQIAALRLEMEAGELPIGTIAMWGNSTIPSGWLELNGDSTTGYPELQTLYGSNLPDFRGEHIRGWSNGATLDSGRILLSKQDDAVKEHKHDIIYSNTNRSLVMAKQSVNSGGNNAVWSHYRYGTGNTYSNYWELNC